VVILEMSISFSHNLGYYLQQNSRAENPHGWRCRRKAYR